MNCSCLRFDDIGSCKHLAAFAKSMNIEIEGLNLNGKFYSRTRQRMKKLYYKKWPNRDQA